MSPGVINYTARDIAELLACSAASVSVVDATERARLEQAATAGDELAQKSLATVADATQGTGLVPAMRSSHRPCVGCAESVPLPDGVAMTTLIVIHGPPQHVLAGVVCTECAAQGRDWVLARHLARIQSFRPAATNPSTNSKETIMFDYGTDFDPAPTTSGPWLHFYAKPSQDGIPAGAWALKDAGSSAILDLSKGFVLDWPAVQTGWVQAQGIPGVAPVKQWNPSRARFEPRPVGDKWQKGFLAPVAYAPDATATWEQWGAGAWMGFSEMFMELMSSAPAQLPNLPLLVPVSARPIKFAQGPSLVPKFTLSRYVSRPACLTESDASSPQIAAQPPQQQRAQVTYSFPPTQAAAQPQQPPRPAPVQPAGWDGPDTVNRAEKVIPIHGPEPMKVRSDTLIDDDIPF